jgi:hypothetical protein
MVNKIVHDTYIKSHVEYLEVQVCAIKRWIPMRYPWQIGSCKNYTPKVIGGEQNDL